MDEKEYYARHLRNMRRSSRRIRAMLEKSYANLGREIAKQQFVSPAAFAWSKNVKLEKRVDLILGQQNFRLKNEITRSIISEWKLASQKNDELVKNYIGDTYVYHKARKELFQANTEALNAFILRTDTKQFNLSKRVWNLTNGTKTQLKYHIGQGIATGKGAAEISRDIRNVLVEPNRLYRRVRDKTGKLVLSKPAKAYKPGSGAYRSSYKNALRLAVTETNMAYRASDHIRRAQLPFIVGYKVNLSGSHPMTDICDDMKGVYPKEFRFVGWHPHCLCYTTAILMEKKKFVKYLKTGKLDKRMYVNKIPIKAERYVNKHATKIAKLKNKPYWTENFNTDLKLKDSIGKMRSMDELKPVGTSQIFTGADSKMREIIKGTRKDGLERSFAVNDKGNMISNIAIEVRAKRKGSVDLPNLIRGYNIKSKGSFPVNLIHTHPEESALSMVDLKAFNDLEGMTSMTNLTLSGKRYTVYRKTYKDFRKVVEEVFSQKRIEAMDYAMDRGLSRKALKQKILDSRLEALKELERLGFIRLEIGKVSL